METFSVLLSDGHAEWWEKLEANNLDHLYDIIDASSYDVVELES